MRFLFALFLLIGLPAMSQPYANKYSGTITASDLKKQLYILAGPEMEGRETATAGQRKASAYIQDYFRSINLLPGNKDSYEQSYDLMKDSMVSAGLAIDNHAYTFGHDFMMSADVNQTKESDASRIVFAGYGIGDTAYNEYDSLDINGAIIVLSLGEPRQGDFYVVSGTGNRSVWSSLRSKIKLAYQKGARGILLVSARSRTIDSLPAFNGRVTNTYLPTRERLEDFNLPVASISQQVFTDIFGAGYSDSIFSTLQNSRPFTPSEHMSVTKNAAITYKENSFVSGASTNVLGLIEGTDKKDEYVFLTAHYDHLGKRGNVIYYGADDDGSGTVSVLEMAEAFSKAKAEGKGPRRTIVFMAVSGEEKGLWGSRYYSDNPVFPLDKTSADLNTDMVGRIDPKRKYGDSLNYIYVIGDDKLSSELKTISESVNKNNTRLELDYKYNDPKDPERIYYRSDHYNFARKGVPILFYFNGTHNDYHEPSDTVEKINYELMEKRVRLIFLTAWEIANRDNLLKRDIPMQ